ncbi:MAG: HAD family hydrolase [Candidatus Solibacter usitatus]|nr:HAD family hydrolase [Candidatus Solibacter usitatus]
MSAALVLFDIDGTLLRRAGPHHRQALVDAVQSVCGIDTTTSHIPVQGMLDGDILAWMLRDAGVRQPRIRQLMPFLMRRAQWIYSRRCPGDLTGNVCPGVVEFLERLRQRRVPACLVSGNLSRIGWKKMERAGLKKYFRSGAFAERGATRADLVRLAMREAREHGWLRRGVPVSLVGDHPNDVRAAKANGVRSVAVLTGVCSKQDLIGESPDVLVEDMRSLRLEQLL